MKGFTFVELLLVIAIVAILLALTIPLGISFYKRQQLDVTTEEVIQALRRAQLKAMSQADYDFGVYLGSGQTGEYILFRGSSYGSHDEEEIFDISDNISFSGLSEVVFSKLEGISSVTGDIVLTSDIDIEIININEVGRINYVYIHCWGIDGDCNSSCQYTDYGSLVDYYADPGCADTCSVTDSFYLNPSGPCSIDGTGICYKADSSNQAFSCSQRDSCEGDCTGKCKGCKKIKNQGDCENQSGCWWEGNKCKGNCDPCNTFTEQTSCDNQQGCSWKTTKWYWNLDNFQEGFSSYLSCEWYE